jgi:hypothetical protein
VTWTLTGSTGTSTVTETETTYTVDASTVIPADEAADLSWSITASAGDVENAPVTVNVALWPAALLLPDAARDYADGTPGDEAKDWTNPSNTELSGTPKGAFAGKGKAVGKSLMVSQYIFGKNASVRSIAPNAAINLYDSSDARNLTPGTWAEMVKHCADSNEGGFTDWYYPNGMEVDDLVYVYKLIAAAVTDQIGHSSEGSESTLQRLCPSCTSSYRWRSINKSGDMAASRCVRRY